MEVGTLLKNLRLGKNISTESVCNNKINPSTLWRIENNKVSPSLENFSIILNGLGMSPSEFFLQMDNTSLEILEYKRKLKVFSNRNDVGQLHILKKEVLEIYEKNKRISSQHLVYLIELIINKKMRSSYDKEAKSSLQNYLFNAEIWTMYEIVLLCNCLFIFDSSDFPLLVYKSLSAFENESEPYEMDIYKTKLMQNVISQLIYENKFIQAKELLIQFSKTKFQSESFYSQFVYSWLKDLINLFLKNDKIFLENLKFKISILRHLELSDEVNLFKSWLNTFEDKYLSLEESSVKI